jgi:uridine kinase
MTAATENEGPNIVSARARETVQVRLNQSQIYEGPVGASLESFIRAARLSTTVPVVAALVDGQLSELTVPVNRDIDVETVSMSSSDGIRIYQRSLTLLLSVATRESFPEARLIVDHVVPLGGFYCEVQGRPPFSPDELTQIESRMRAIVNANEPIVRESMLVTEAIEMFRSLGYDDKVRLLQYRKKDYVTVYSLLGHYDYFYGYMTPSTGYLKYFSLSHQVHGFILHFPARFGATDIPNERRYPQLISAFLEYGGWLNLLGVRDVAALNNAVESGRIREVVLVSEALHEQRVAKLASNIADRHDRVRLVFVAGPSSAGKTTFTRRLAIQLLAHGVRPVYIGLDNYFVDREQTPLDEQGEYDFEALESIDLHFFHEQIPRLMRGEMVTLPHYNFVTGLRESGPTVKIGEDHVILLEGLHGLNPALVPSLPSESIYRVYASPLTQLNLDHHNRIPTSDTRLLRRITRDASQRGYSVTSTIQRWESVRRGEVKYIFPFQSNADVIFNSALVYELAVLQPFVLPLLRQVEPGTLEYVEAKRLMSFLEWIEPCTCDLVPDNSILREFIGGSILEDYMPELE